MIRIWLDLSHTGHLSVPLRQTEVFILCWGPV
uniref:Uncharacterized protein n=1 Tax=Anguilla anguilla TaxID=7936 RepID=A0A0E9Y009_ANGAN